MGILVAQMMLNLLFSRQQASILGGNSMTWSYASFSYGQKYYNNMQAALNGEKTLIKMAQVAELLKIGYDSYFDLKIVKNTAINFLEYVIRLQVDAEYRQDNINSLTK